MLSNNSNISTTISHGRHKKFGLSKLRSSKHQGSTGLYQWILQKYLDWCHSISKSNPIKLYNIKAYNFLMTFGWVSGIWSLVWWEKKKEENEREIKSMEIERVKVILLLWCRIKDTHSCGGPHGWKPWSFLDKFWVSSSTLWSLCYSCSRESIRVNSRGDHPQIMHLEVVHQFLNCLGSLSLFSSFLSHDSRCSIKGLASILGFSFSLLCFFLC